MAKYRKKPVVIEAFENVPGRNAPAWLAEAIVSGAVVACGLTHTLEIQTLEGTMVAGKGDFVIRGVKGEIYPCKPDIFAATYELFDES
ncbi:MAG TPA: hypothetical protein VGK73_31640 [Polyangiaceae bacterium]